MIGDDCLITGRGLCSTEIEPAHGIISTLASQFDAQVVTVSGPQGIVVWVTHSMFGSM
jgi:hypothetical protein